jgi:hypothetical protein
LVERSLGKEFRMKRTALILAAVAGLAATSATAPAQARSFHAGNTAAIAAAAAAAVLTANAYGYGPGYGYYNGPAPLYYGAPVYFVPQRYSW